MHNKNITEIFVVIVAVFAISFLFGTNYDSLVGNEITGKYTGSCDSKNHEYLSSSGECICEPSYIREGGICVKEESDSIECPKNSYTGSDGSCYCPHGTFLDEKTNICLGKTDCGKSGYYDNKANKCVCFEGYRWEGGECVLSGTSTQEQTYTPPVVKEPEEEKEEVVEEEPPKVVNDDVVAALPIGSTTPKSSGTPWGMILGIGGGVLALGLISIILVRKFKKGGLDEDEEDKGESLQEKIQPRSPPSDQGNEQPLTPTSGPPVNQMSSQRRSIPPPVRRMPPPGRQRPGPLPRGNLPPRR